jgi:hypothetical protein
MKVHIERRWELNAVDIYLVEASADMTGRIMQIVGPDAWQWQDVAPGEKPAPSFSLPLQAFELIVAGAGDFLPPSAATDAALKDTREVRDRLLALIERVVPTASTDSPREDS